MTRASAVLAMRKDLPDKLFDPAARERLSRLVDIDFALCLDTFDGAGATSALAEASVLLTGWDCPTVDARVLARAPKLAAVVHAGGSVKGHLDPACWERGLDVSTAAAANAVPVAEFTLAMILLAGKGVPAIAHLYRRRRAAVDLLAEFPRIGNHRRRVGVVGASRIGRRVLRLLRPFDFELAVHDPYLDDPHRGGPRSGASVVAELGASRMELPALLRWADIVSLHAPALPETRRLLDARRLALMPDGATLVNTARGALVDLDALTAELVSGRLNAALDVTEPEVLPADSPLYHLPNVVLTPHVAGSLGNELARLGDWAVDEVERFTRGEPFAGPVRMEDLGRMA